VQVPLVLAAPAPLACRLQRGDLGKSYGLLDLSAWSGTSFDAGLALEGDEDATRPPVECEPACLARPGGRRHANVLPNTNAFVGRRW